MNETQQTGTALQSLRILYFAILAGTVMIAAIFYFVSQDSEPILSELRGNILVIALFAATICLAISAFMWRKDIAKIRQAGTPLSSMFDAYRAACIKRYAIAEFAAIFAVICYFLSMEPRLYIVVGILIAHFLTMFPTAARIARDLEVSEADIQNL